MRRSIGKGVAKTIALMYVFAVLYLTMMSANRYTGIFDEHNINLIPFSNKWIYFSNFFTLQTNAKLFVIKETIGNFFLLMPFAWSYCVFFGKIKQPTMVVLIVFLALTIENLQYWLHIGTFDIDDIILNIAGGLFGAFLFYRMHKRN
ncbi:VanZ family protein [Flavobacterium rivuli]|nr:VanZ family protein [Flavobacterium rivuli]